MTLAEHMRGKRPTFKPVPHVNLDGQQITWFWSDEPCVTESIHHDGKWVGSVHRSVETKQIVGVNVHCEAIAGLGSLLAAMADAKEPK